MEEITDLDQVLRLAGQRGSFNLVDDFGVSQERVNSLDMATQLAMAAGIDALRDAGIPLVMNYRKTSRGTSCLIAGSSRKLQDETGIIFCSAFPGLNRMAEESDRFSQDQILSKQLEELRIDPQPVQPDESNRSDPTQQTKWIGVSWNSIQQQNELDYHFDRRYVFRILSMGHSQFAEYIGAKGPNTHVNAACATTTHGIAVAEDWIRSGRCRRVIVIAGDDVTNP